MRHKTGQAPEQVAESARALGHSVGDFWKSFAGLKVPIEAVSELQTDYVKQATELWNQTLSRAQADGEAKAAPPAPLADRRFAAPEWAANPAAAYTAQMYLLNARTLMQLADSIEGDPKTRAQGALRRAAVDRRDEPGQLHGAQPRGAEEGARHQGRERDPGPDAAVERPAQGLGVADRRDGVRGRPQRGHQRRLGGVRERAVPAHRVQAADAQGAPAAVPDGAAVHQQVLHPRPAARELADPLHRRAGPPHVRDELAQPRRVDGRARLGRLHRAGPDRGDAGGARDQRPGRSQRAGLLRRRHDHRHRAGGAGRAWRAARRTR